jgi:inorganic pyrophosphatase
MIRLAHPWHGIEVDPDQIAHACPSVIEIPKGSKCKYELDKSSGMLKLDRMLHGSMHYEFNYGFIPRSYGDDGDPLDICVVSSEPVDPLTLLHARPLSVMRMSDEGRRDDKIIAVCNQDPPYEHLETLEDLPEYHLRAFRHFFERYKEMEHKQVIVDRFLSREEALRTIQEALDNYQQHREELLPSTPLS